MVFKNQKKINPEIIQRSQHNIDPKLIDKDAKEVINSLESAGFDAFVVGGGVRDLLLGKKPKDFDVATNATPEEIKKTLPRSRIIGRRFKLVHFRRGRNLIEVATFRSSDKKRVSKNQQGRVLRDNVYGNIREDAFRRDFKINALYLNVNNLEIIDYTGGFKDLKERKLTCIGDSDVRFREDPVRTIRAIRFMAALDLKCEESLKSNISKFAHLLEGVPSARRYEEVLKLFLTGSAVKVLNQLISYDVLRYLLPGAAKSLKDKESGHQSLKFINLSLNNSDERVKNDLPLTPAFLFSVLLWPSLVKRIGEVQSNKSKIPALRTAANLILKQQYSHCFIPNRIENMIKEIWEMQIRLLRTDSSKALDLLTNPRFRAAYDFLLLREKLGVNLNKAGEWWTKAQAENGVTKKKFTKQRPKYR